MFLLKLLMKVLLLPVMLVLFVLRVLVKIGIELSSIIVGGLILIVFGCIIYAIVQQMWPSMWILIAMEAVLIIVTAGAGMLDVLLEEAIVANMDNFNNRLLDHFTEMQTIGREISLDIKVFANNAAGIDLESEFGDEELLDIINNWLQLNTVQGRFSMPYASENVANFTQVRIPVYDERGRAVDANGFAKGLAKMLKKEPYNIPSKVLVKGLGRAVIILGEK